MMTPTELYLRLVFGDAYAQQVMAEAARTVHELCRFTQPLTSSRRGRSHRRHARFRHRRRKEEMRLASGGVIGSGVWDRQPGEALIPIEQPRRR